MEIVVIVKRIDSSDNSPDSRILDIGDKTALDMAISLREKHGLGNSTVSVLCIAPVDASDVIRECYSIGADVGYLLADPAFEAISDITGLINILSSAINRLNGCDIVIMASHSTDTATIHVGSLLAENLKLKHVQGIEHFEGQGQHRIVIRGKNQEREVIEIPVLINLACDSELKVQNAMRIMKAFKKDVKIINSRDLEMGVNKRPAMHVADNRKRQQMGGSNKY